MLFTSYYKIYFLILKNTIIYFVATYISFLTPIEFSGRDNASLVQKIRNLLVNEWILKPYHHRSIYIYIDPSLVLL